MESKSEDNNIEIFNISKKQVELINRNFKSIENKISKIEKKNNVFCLCYSIINLIFNLIIIIFNICIFSLVLWILYSILYPRIRYINYAPSKNLLWRCYNKELNIPIVSNPYFNHDCRFNYIQCEKFNTSIYKNMENSNSFNNYSSLVDYALLDQFNCITYKSDIYINNYLNNYLVLNTYTTYKNNTFYYNLDLHCKYNEINLYNISVNFDYRISNFMNKYYYDNNYFSSFVNEFSINCTNQLKYYFLK